MIRKLLSDGVTVTAAAIALSIAPVAIGGAGTLAAKTGDVHVGSITNGCTNPKECPQPRPAPGGSTTVLAATNGDIYVGGISANGRIHLGGKASGCPDSPDCPLPDRIWPDN